MTGILLERPEMDALAQENLRAAFPICQESAYFQWAYRGAPSTSALALMDDVLQAHAKGGASERPRWFAAYESVGQKFAQMHGARYERLAYTPNTAFAMGMVANGLDWAKGDEILIAAEEFPSNVYPWMQLERQGVKVRVVSGRDGQPASAEDLLNAIGPKTRLIAASHVSFHSGYRLDIAALAAGCREAGVISIVDAAQSMGWAALNVDAIGADCLTGVGRKFLCGLDGVGVMALSDQLNAKLRVTSPGPFSVKHQSEYLHHVCDWREDAGRFAGGGIASLPIFALGASLDLFEAAGGMQAVEAQALLNAKTLRRALAAKGVACLGSEWGADQQSAVVKVLSDDPSIVGRLSQAGVSVSLRPGGLRVAVHAMNNAEDIARLVALF